MGFGLELDSKQLADITARMREREQSRVTRSSGVTISGKEYEKHEKAKERQRKSLADTLEKNKKPLGSP